MEAAVVGSYVYRDLLTAAAAPLRSRWPSSFRGRFQKPEGLKSTSPGFTRGDERKPWVPVMNGKAQSDDVAEAPGSPAAHPAGTASTQEAGVVVGLCPVPLPG